MNGGAGDDTLYAYFDDTLSGGVGNDTLDAALYGNTLYGGTGNDTYIIEDINTITEAANSGIDTVRSATFSYTLDSNLENLTLTQNRFGDSAIDGTGNTLNNTITGNSANNTLNGGAGNDTLIGGLGTDTLMGGTGIDSLTGGGGSDILTGGTSTDRFVFESKIEGIDTITDFSVVDDTINVSAAGFGNGLTSGAAITLDQFVLGTAADASDRFIYNQSTGALFFDEDGTDATGQLQLAKLSTGLAMTNADIFVV